MNTPDRVYVQTNKGDFFTEYSWVNIEDATGVFYSGNPHDKATGNTYQIAAITNIADCPSIIVITNHNTGVVFHIEARQLLQWVHDQFTDPTVKFVSFPALMGTCEQFPSNLSKIGMKYQYDKQGFVRAKRPTVPTEVPKKYINEFTSILCNFIQWKICIDYGFNNVDIATNTSKASKINAVVLAKKLGFTLDELCECWVHKRADNTVHDKKYPSVHHAVDLVLQKYKVSPTYNKQLVKIVKAWWKDAKVVTR